MLVSCILIPGLCIATGLALLVTLIFWVCTLSSCFLTVDSVNGYFVPFIVVHFVVVKFWYTNTRHDCVHQSKIAFKNLLIFKLLLVGLQPALLWIYTSLHCCYRWTGSTQFVKVMGTSSWIKLGECRTMWGKHEQTIHSFNLYQRLFSQVSDHSTCRWHGM